MEYRKREVSLLFAALAFGLRLEPEDERAELCIYDMNNIFSSKLSLPTTSKLRQPLELAPFPKWVPLIY